MVRPRKIGLIGTVIRDRITYESGHEYSGIGGILYQSAFFCGLKKEVFLFTHLGEELAPEFKKITSKWNTLAPKGIRIVPGAGNEVHLHYPLSGERIEVLNSVVPPLKPVEIIPDLVDLDFLIFALNSGLDMDLFDWLQVKKAAQCCIWLDLHSLALENVLCQPRKYHAIPEWKEWAKDVSFLQANQNEVAAACGSPESPCTQEDIHEFADIAFENNVKNVLVTLGEEGVMVLTPDQIKKVSSGENNNIIKDTTGCGDIFCAAAVAELIRGKDVFSAAKTGVEMASLSAGLTGVEAVYDLAINVINLYMD